ncbi:MAG: glycosyltransferase family 39 protein [Bacteroidia bacterium]|nr:glycosyltransferase family 39 protein [Bacteroidia bacterium]
MSRFTDSIKYILLLLIIAIPVFGFLDTLPVRLWDESRVGMNALEMFYNGDYLVAHYDGNPDMWNTKPPLMLWLQVFFMYIFGPGEIALRLPSAFAVLLTFVALLLFCKRYLKNFWLGFITVLCLVTTANYMNFHVARSGDYDALLVLFSTTACLFFYAFCETKQSKYLYYFFAAFTLGVYTKGVTILMFGPALLIYAIITVPLRSFLKNKHFYIGLFSSVFLVLGFYLLRESQNPGYIKAVGENELGGRFLVDQINSKSSFWFYYDNFLSFDFADRYLLIPCGFLIGIFNKDQRIKKITLFIGLICLIFFLIISCSKTKYSWYDAPICPWFAFFTALIVELFFRWLKETPAFLQTLTRNVVPYLFLFLIFITPYRQVWSRTYSPSETQGEEDYYHVMAYLKDATRGNVHMHNKYVVYEDYNAPLYFYVEILKRQKVNTGFKSFNELKKGDVVLVSWDPTREKIKKAFKCVEIHERYSIYTLIILDPKTYQSAKK